MTKTIVKTYGVINDYIRLICQAFLIGCLFLIAIYSFHLFSLISKTVAMEKIESEFSSLSGSIDSLDEQFLALSGKITPDNISQYGLSKGKVSQYISRSTKIGVLENANHVALINER